MYLKHIAVARESSQVDCLARFFYSLFLIRLCDRRVWRRHGNLLIWIFRNDVVLLVREAEDQHCAALVRASAVRREEESGAGLFGVTLPKGFQFFFPNLVCRRFVAQLCRKMFGSYQSAGILKFRFYQHLQFPMPQKSGNMLYIEQKKKSR